MPTCGASPSRACSASSIRRQSSTRCSCPLPAPAGFVASPWASSPRRTSRSSGGARCSTRPWSSSSPTSSGTTRTSCSSTCRRARATSRCRSLSSSPERRSTWSPPRSRPPSEVAQRAGFMAQKVNLEVKGVIENMSWFTGDDGKRYELFGAGGGDELAERLGVPLLGQIPLVTELRAGGDAGRPIVLDRARRRRRPRLRSDRRAHRGRAGAHPALPQGAQGPVAAGGSPPSMARAAARCNASARGPASPLLSSRGTRNRAISRRTKSPATAV